MHKRKAKLKNDNSREARIRKKHERAMQTLRQKRYRERKKAKKESPTKQNSLAAFVFIYVLLQFLLPTLHKFTIQYNTIPEENSSEPNVQAVDNDGSRKAYYRQYRRVKRATQSRQKQQTIRTKDRERKVTENKKSIGSKSPSTPVLQNIQSQIKSAGSYASSIASLIDLLHQERGKPCIRIIISDHVKNKHFDFRIFVST